MRFARYNTRDMNSFFIYSHGLALVIRELNGPGPWVKQCYWVVIHWPLCVQSLPYGRSLKRTSACSRRGRHGAQAGLLDRLTGERDKEEG